MNWRKETILAVLDQCAKNFTFPMLDNGYVYLACTRMSVFRSEMDWAIVIEVFGYSPRSGIPDIQIYTFASALHNRNVPSKYVSKEAYDTYLQINPYNESKFIFPIENQDWLNAENPESVDPAGICNLRGIPITIPLADEFAKFGIALQEDVPFVFEFCRYLAETHRDVVLANESERRISLLPNMEQILQLEEWRHPDLADGELPSSTNTFIQIANLIVTGKQIQYQPNKANNTHWENWPAGGTL